MAKDKQKLVFDISILSILKIVGVLAALWFLYFIRDILAILFVSIIFAAAIDPFVTMFEKRKIPRGFGVIIIYLILVIVILLVVALIIPPMVKEVGQLTANFPVYWEKIVEGFTYLSQQSEEQSMANTIRDSLESIQLGLQKATTGVFSVVSSIFGGIFSFIMVLVITFYLVVSEESIKKIFRSIAPPSFYPYLSDLFIRMQKKIGDWLRGELILILSVFSLSLVGLLILRVKYALVLAVLAGLFEIIPYVGPVLGAIPAVFLVFVQSPFKAVLVIILYVIIQQIENNLLVPKVMEKTVGLNPVVIIVVLLIGAKLGGIVGAILAVPVATAASVVVKDFYQTTKETIKEDHNV